MLSAQRILVADVGGTHTRLALAVSRGGGRVQLEATHSLTTGTDLGLLLETYLESQGRPPLDGLGVCAAGPLNESDAGPEIRLTNQPITVRIDELAQRVGAVHAVLLNDFTAVAHAIPVLTGDELRPLGAGQPRRNAAIGVLGAGTGLGVSGLVPAGERWTVLEGEGGHRDLHGGSAAERAVLDLACEDAERLSAEDVLSGPGLERLYRAVQRAAGREPERLPAAEIARRAFERQEAAACRSIDLFTVLLGRVAGDLALTLGARGGVFLAGGILPAWGEHFSAARFREGFEDKAPMRAYVAAIPSYLVLHPQPGLLGAASCVQARMLQAARA